MNFAMNTACTSAVANGPAPTATEILAKLESVEPRLIEIRRAFHEKITRVLTNRLCTARAPVRVHKKRTNQTEAYHRRIQKKWIKRFGQKDVLTGFLIDNSFIGGRGRTLVLHPDLVR